MHAGFVIRQEQTSKTPVRYWRRVGGWMLSKDLASIFCTAADAQLEIQQQSLEYATCTIEATTR